MSVPEEKNATNEAAADNSGRNCVPNAGNPVFTPHNTVIQSATTMVTCPVGTLEDMAKPQHPMYVTTSSTYGYLQPSIETTPTSFHGRSQKFSKHLSQSGMYRNHSLNTARDHTRV